MAGIDADDADVADQRAVHHDHDEAAHVAVIDRDVDLRRTFVQRLEAGVVGAPESHPRIADGHHPRALLPLRFGSERADLHHATYFAMATKWKMLPAMAKRCHTPCVYATFFDMAKKTTPTVYAMPPAINSVMAGDGSASFSGAYATITSQPITT